LPICREEDGIDLGIVAFMIKTISYCSIYIYPYVSGTVRKARSQNQKDMGTPTIPLISAEYLTMKALNILISL
jgi:hypothetical protein